MDNKSYFFEYVKKQAAELGVDINGDTRILDIESGKEEIDGTADESLDIIYDFSAFAQLCDKAAEAWIEECARILKPNGIFVAATKLSGLHIKYSYGEYLCFGKYEIDELLPHPIFVMQKDIGSGMTDEQLFVHRGEVVRLSSEIDSLKWQLYVANCQNDFVNSTLSWRMTKPCRWLGKNIRITAKKITPLRLLVKFLRSLHNDGLKYTLDEFRDVEHREKIATDLRVAKANSALNPSFVYVSEYQDNIDFSGYSTDVKALVFYLPQFHRIPENDRWWGEGFTEWTNTKKARPRFEGQYQPRIPHKDFGYYTLDSIGPIEKQVKLAKQHGIYGFCFYHYWFSGKRLLEKPVDLFLQNPQVDINFCICWANENWTRRWDGADKEILIEQEYLEDDPLRFIDDLKLYLDDPRYIRVDGKPVIIVYNPKEIKGAQQVFEKWRIRARENGIGEILIWVCNTHEYTAERLYLTPFVDASVEFPPHNSGSFAEYAYVYGENASRSGVWNYQTIVNIMKLKLGANKTGSKTLPLYRTATLGWDNTARKKVDSVCLSRYSLQGFYDWCGAIVDHTDRVFEKDKRFIFINAWNEWAEGTYLEPDEKYGYANINTFSKALFRLPLDNNGG